MTHIEQIETARLTLSRASVEDVEDVIRLNADPVAMAMLGGVRARGEVEERMRLLQAHWQRHGFGPWIARLRGTGSFAGMGGLRHVEIAGATEIEVGYSFTPAMWGQGLATELARASVDVAFRSLELVSLVSFTLPTNAASRRVMEKAGFVFERDVDYKDLPHVMYRQTRASWERAPRPAA